MKLFYIRHAEPVYNPHSLTELGFKQAEALSVRLKNVNFDKIFASPAERTMLTATPTAKKLNMDIIEADFANEKYAVEEFATTVDGKITWIFSLDWAKRAFTSPEVRALGDRWFDYPAFKEYNFEKAINRVYNDVDKFMLELGYQHERYTGRYKIVKPKYNNVALVAHGGFGRAFLSCLLDIPYPQLAAHFEICYTGMTVIDFKECGEGYAIPVLKTFASDGHLFSEKVECEGIDY